VAPPGRFGVIRTDGVKVAEFSEKPVGDGTLINGGFFVLSPDALNFIESDDTIWERQPLQRLAAEGELTSFAHDGFWQPMDTLRERDLLHALWESGRAPWKNW